MKGIILAGGVGSRLWPATISVSKHLLPVHDKPMIYYPLSNLMLAGIREILLISTPKDCDRYKNLLGQGDDLGITIEYRVQTAPRGIADAFIVGEEFIGDDPITLILGDNIFYGDSFPTTVKEGIRNNTGATIFCSNVSNPDQYGIVELDTNGLPVSIEEKPVHPRSNMAVAGMYIYDNRVVDLAKTLLPSPRGELEISCINRFYLEAGSLVVNNLGRGIVWYDTGSVQDLSEASIFVASFERRHGLKIACLEEIAWRNGWIDRDQVKDLSARFPNHYGEYLRNLIRNG